VIAILQYIARIDFTVLYVLDAPNGKRRNTYLWSREKLASVIVRCCKWNTKQIIFSLLGTKICGRWQSPWNFLAEISSWAVQFTVFTES